MRYEQVWNAVDNLAKVNGLSPSGLAKKAGLDSTTFNKSKRIRNDGNKRWPSLESINKIITACNISFDQFYSLGVDGSNVEVQSIIPYTRASKLGMNVNLNKKELDTALWEKIRFPDSKDNIYAINLDTNDFEPYYPMSTMLIVSKNSEIRSGDKVVIIMQNEEVLVKQFIKRTARTIELKDICLKGKETDVKIGDVKLINRILWASQ